MGSKAKANKYRGGIEKIAAMFSDGTLEILPIGFPKVMRLGDTYHVIDPSFDGKAPKIRFMGKNHTWELDR